METLDQDDIRAALAGDGQAYARLVERYQTEVGRTLWRFSRHRPTWEELVQEVFVEAYMSLATYQSRAPFIHWLRRIATRVGYRFWKRSRRALAQGVLPLQETDKAAATAPEASGPEDAAALVHRLLEQLPPRDRLVLSLKYLEECSVAEMACRTGWSETMVKVQTFRAHRRLRELWERMEKEG